LKLSAKKKRATFFTRTASSFTGQQKFLRRGSLRRDCTAVGRPYGYGSVPAPETKPHIHLRLSRDKGHLSCCAWVNFVTISAWIANDTRRSNATLVSVPSTSNSENNHLFCRAGLICIRGGSVIAGKLERVSR
jgi:hypothetical protein